MYTLDMWHLLACWLAMAAFCCRHVHSIDMQQFSLHVYGNDTHEISPLLFGIFFEEASLCTLLCYQS